MRRARKHIPLIELLASALADKLPAWLRAAHVRQQSSARTIVSMFTPDHIKLHAWGGADKWWNIDMRLRGADLKAKDRADTSRAAKAVRIDKKWGEFTRKAGMGFPKPPKRRRKTRWPSRPFNSKKR